MKCRTSELVRQQTLRIGFARRERNCSRALVLAAVVQALPVVEHRRDTGIIGGIVAGAGLRARLRRRAGACQRECESGGQASEVSHVLSATRRGAYTSTRRVPPSTVEVAGMRTIFPAATSICAIVVALW